MTNLLLPLTAPFVVIAGAVYVLTIVYLMQ
jgi:hypothetical protein